LPRNVTKAQAVAVAALRMTGVTATDIVVYRDVADRAARAAWHDPARAPVNWRRECDMARELGLSERQFRNIERRLDQFGVLAEAEVAGAQRQECILHVRSAKQRVRRSIEGLADPEPRAWAETAYEKLKNLCPKGTLRGLAAARWR